MRQRQLTVGSNGTKALRGCGQRILWLMMAAVFLLGQGAVQAVAQFSGPSLTASTSVNLPMPPTTDPGILYPGPRELRLEHGDLISVHLYGIVDFQPVVRVSLDGDIQLPLVGLIHVQGLSLHEVENLIAERLVSA